MGSQRLIAPVVLAAVLLAAPVQEGGGPKGPDRVAPAFARKITEEDDLIRGPTAAGRVGDWVIGNDRIRVIISAVDQPTGFARSGGNIIDAAPVGGQDLLQLVFTYLDDTFPRQVIYRSLQARPMSEDGRAAILAEGEDSDDPAVRATTTYRLAPGDPFVTIETRIQRKEGAGDIEAYELGDAIQWGATEHFAPGLGFDLPGRAKSPWLAGIGAGTSYGYLGEGEVLDCRHGRSWSDPIVKTSDLPAGGTVAYTRTLIVGPGDAASIFRSVRSIRGASGRSVAGRVVAGDRDAPVAGARVDLYRKGEGHPFLFAITDAGGRFDLPVPTGDFVARASAPGRKATGKEPITEDLLFRLGPAGGIRFTIRDGAGEGVPGRITIEGQGGTPDPDLGPPFRAAGARNLVLTGTGEGEAAIPPGRYRVTASRGPEYSIDTRTIEVGGGDPVPLDLRVHRAVDTTGYLACDFHQHAAMSADSGLSLEDRVISNLAEGLEVMVSTDHDTLTDFAPVIRRLGVGDRILSIVGDEVTPGSLGHFNAFPLRPDPSALHQGAIDHWGKTPGEIFAALRAAPPREKVIQVNHPRSGSLGYFSTHRLDTGTGEAEVDGFSWEFDAIEVMNGLPLAGVDEMMEDWFRLLNRGRTYLPTGNSDSHDVFRGRAGYPRNYVWLGEDDVRKVTPGKIVEALKVARSVVVTNGPFLTLEGPGGARIGSVVHHEDREVPVRIRLQVPGWMEVDRLEVVCNGEVRRRVDLPPGSPREMALSIPVDGDGWIVAVARGEKPMDPVVPVAPIAFTNPIWIDREGNGFDPPTSPR